MPEYACLVEEDGKIHIVEIKDEVCKYKGLGVLNTKQLLDGYYIGDEIIIGQKRLTLLPPRLPELNRGMVRRAQTISPKDAGLFITKLGLGPGDTVVEAGIGSGGLSLHLARVIGSSGKLITADTRDDHAEIALENLQRAKSCFPEFPEHIHLSGALEDVVIPTEDVDAVLLDMPKHEPAIRKMAPLLNPGGRIACYCPVSSQLENCMLVCEELGLQIDWAGELMERPWSRAGKGGVRPSNGPFGHTAFLLIAQKR